MKKCISLILSIAVLLSVVPFTVIEPSAASGRIYEDIEYSMYCSSAGTWNVKTFVPEEDGIYIFSSSGSLDTLGYIALAEGEAENQYIKADGGQDNNFAVTYNMKAGTTYYLGSTVLMGPVGSYKIKIIKFEIDDGTIHPITLSQSTQVSTSQSKNVKFLSITPATSGKFIYLSSGNYDTQGYIFDEYWQQIAYSDIGGAAQNFQIELDLQAGKTYYVGYATTSETTAKFNVMLYMTTYIRTVSPVSAPEKDTYIKDIDAKFVSGVTYHVDLNLYGFTFKVNYANGTSEEKRYTYGIRGLDCEPSRNLLAGENDVRFSYMGNSGSFKIYVKDSPVLRLEMLQAPDKTTYYDEDMETAIDNVSKIFNIRIDGMIIRVFYTDGTTDDFTVTSLYGGEIEYFFFDHMIPAADMQLGDNTFTLTYYGKPLSFTVKYSLNSANWQYEIHNGEITLTKYIGTDVNAVIPETLGGYPVTTIGDSCFENNTDLKTVKMTERITTIGDKAFYGCTALKELTLPASLTSIGTQACFNLKGLEKLNWNTPNLSVARANNTFAYMGNDTANGTTVEFGFTCQAIPQDAFYNQSNTYAPNIGKIIVGENVTSIGNNAFRELSKLKTVEWNAIGITANLGAANNIWYNSGSASSFTVTFGENVQSIPSYLFYAANATRAPRVSQMTVLSKNTLINDNSVVANTAVPLTYYCHYNSDTTIKSVYNHCVSNNLNYVLLDSPLDHIYIKKALTKDEYIIGEVLDLTGLSVYAVFEDYSEEDVTDAVTVTGYDKDTLGAQTLTLSYTFIDKTATATLQVVVTEEPLVLDYLTITTPASVNAFYTGDVFESTGLQVQAAFTNGFTQDVSDLVIISGYDMNTAGVQDVAVSYTFEGVTRTITYPIQVTALVLTGLTVDTLPDKTDYLAGEEMNPDGLKVIASYNSGKNADVTGLCVFSGYNMLTTGLQSVQVTYAENAVSKTVAFPIFVHNDLTSVTIDTLPATTTFTVGTGFSAKDIAVTAHYENGASTDVSDAVTFSGYDMNTTGEQTVTVGFTDNGITKTATYSITVTDRTLLRLVLTSAPTVSQYLGEALNITGLNISAIYSDSSRENVASQCVFTGYDMSVTGTQTVTAAYTYGDTQKSVTFEVTVAVRNATGISIASPAAKTAYMVGETLDTTGLALRLNFDNGTYEPIDLARVAITGFDATVPGAQTVTLHYTYKGTEYTAQYAVSVTNYEVSMQVTPPAKTAYYYGENFAADGMAVTLTMADGSRQTLTSGFTCAGYNKNKIGTQTVTVTYHSTVLNRDFTDTFTVSVQNFETAISVSAPQKTTYYYGEALDTTGMSALLTFADGTQKLADITKLNVSDFDAETLGTQTLTVGYTNVKGETLSDTFSVNVLNFASSITVTAPTQTAYFYGDMLDTAGLQVVAVMEDGTGKVLSAGDYTISAFDSHTLGTQVLEVGYTNEKGDVLTDSFSVSVKNFAQAITLTPPTKTEYYYGEALNPAGMSVTAVMADGARKALSASQYTLSGFDAETLGTQQVAVRYTNEKGAQLTDTFAVTVLNFESGITVTAPAKTVYYYGENLDTAGLQVFAIMEDGSSPAISLSDVTLSGYDPYTLGTQVITVEYISVKGEPLSDVFTVRVDNYEKDITVTPPQKLNYYYGETLATAGLTATVTMADGSAHTVPTTALAVTGFDAARLGEQTLTVSYTGVTGAVLTDTFKVTVQNYESAIAVTPPARVKYYYGESLNTAGLAAVITMADGSEKTVGADKLTLSAFDGTVLGEQTITVTYQTVKGETLTGSFTVTVTNYETGLSVLPPAKTEYFYGDALNTTGMSSKLTSASGESMEFDSSKLSVSGYNARKLGAQTITVSYTASTGEVLRDTFSVVVKNFERSITIGAPDKTTYFYGESINKTGMTVSAVMADGSTGTVDANDLIVFGYSATKLGEQTVTGMYRNAKNATLTGTFKVTVVNYEKALTVTAPTKTEYYYGEALDTAGMQGTLTMADGSTAAAETEKLSVVAFNPNRLGTQTITVQYENAKGETLSDTFSVLIHNYPQRITLSGDYPTVFTEGDTFSYEGLHALAHFADGSRKDVTSLVSVTGYDMAAVGTQTVTVTYSEGEKSVSAAYEITVKKYESEVQRADVNEDGFIDMSDVSVVLATANFGLPVEQAENARADVDRNGTVDVSDMALLLKAENYAHTVTLEG